MNKEEFCIMPDNPPYWRNYRFSDSTYLCNRHECFFGTRNRKKSIEDGLVVFLTPKLHNKSNKGVHFNWDFNLYIKQEAEKAWLKYYNKTIEDFVARYGRNYLEE